MPQNCGYLNRLKTKKSGAHLSALPPLSVSVFFHAKRFVRSIKQECLSRLIFLSEGHLRSTIALYADHYRHRRNHQGIENKLIEPPALLPKVGQIRCQKQLGGMLNRRVC